MLPVATLDAILPTRSISRPKALISCKQRPYLKFTIVREERLVILAGGFDLLCVTRGNEQNARRARCRVFFKAPNIVRQLRAKRTSRITEQHRRVAALQVFRYSFAVEVRKRKVSRKISNS